MSGRRISLLINSVRESTDNKEFGSGYGIQDSEFIQYMNDAQDRLQMLIEQTHPRTFVKEEILDIVKDQEEYALPLDSMIGNRITSVEYSPSQNIKDYYYLLSKTLKERSTAVFGQPLNYIRRSGQILINPIPSNSNGKLRLNFVEKLPDLDIRRGQITGSTGTPLTQITTDDTTGTNDQDIIDRGYICVVDRDGAVKARRIPVTNAVNGVITVDSHTLDTDESITNGEYVVTGTYASSHSRFATNNEERYILQYCRWKILKRDSSQDAASAEAELAAMETEIVESYADISDDVMYVPLLSPWESFE